ncbi:MAG TPA: DNA replication/repair protein RecF [Coxiellaceae bacterium]|nr:DNA replication/repair protein RecF [Coxiellaceae bacterium]
MAYIDSLRLYNFRNFPREELLFSRTINFFYGNNGSGKTSLLEALYVLSFGRSFRTANYHHLIQDKEGYFIISVSAQDGQTSIPLGIERQRDGIKLLKLNELKANQAAISDLLPIQLLSPYSYRFFTDGPKLRRQYLDWGMFHVEPSFQKLWARLQKTLKQRNALLKAKRTIGKEIAYWDQELINIAEILQPLYKKYTHSLQERVFKLLKRLLGPQIEVNIHYYAGWDENCGLKSHLMREFAHDLRLGYTQYGPHKADLLISVNNIPIQDYFSQGQLKLAAYAFYLGQGLLLTQVTNKTPIYLLDDLPSELDAEKQTLVLGLLSEIKAQIFITGIEQESFKLLQACQGSRMFHVKQGMADFVSIPLETVPLAS